MNQPQQQKNQQQPPQQQPQKPAKFEPDRRTIFLVQTDVEFEPRARDYVLTEYGDGIRDPQTDELKHAWRIQTELNPIPLTRESTIVVLTIGGDRIRGADGKWRIRDKKGFKENGIVVREPEPPMVLESQPFKCSDFWTETVSGDAEVDRLALIRAINAKIAPNRAQLDERTPAAKSKDPQFSISVRAT